MISTYEDTWQMLVSNITRPTDTPRLQTLKIIDDFIRQTKTRDRIVDIGCGNNLYKSYYPDWDIYGVDKTFESDMFGFIEDFTVEKFGGRNIMAINSVGYGKGVKDSYKVIEKRILQMYGALPIGGKLLLTLNNYPEKDCDNKTPAYDWWTHYRFENLDKVIYYHLKTPELKKDLRQKISKYLKKDNEWQEYKRINKIRTSDDSYASDIWNKSVKTDNRFGTLRVILQRTK